MGTPPFRRGERVWVVLPGVFQEYVGPNQKRRARVKLPVTAVACGVEFHDSELLAVATDAVRRRPR